MVPRPDRALSSSSSFLLPKAFVGINAEVIFITDGELLLCLLCFSLFLPRLPLSFRQSSQVNGHLVNTGKTVSGQRCEVYQRNKQNHLENIHLVETNSSFRV